MPGLDSSRHWDPAISNGFAFPTSALFPPVILRARNGYYVNYGLPMRYPEFTTSQYVHNQGYTVVLGPRSEL